MKPEEWILETSGLISDAIRRLDYIKKKRDILNEDISSLENSISGKKSVLLEFERKHNIKHTVIPPPRQNHH